LRRNTIGLIWLTGILLAFALYATGPERFVDVVVDALDQIGASIQDAFYLIGVRAFEAMRAMAIAGFGVFVALAMVASRRGLRARGALVLVTLLFVALLAGPGSGTPIRPDRWLEAFVLTMVGAGVMTQRLVQAKEGGGSAPRPRQGQGPLEPLP